MPNNTNHDAKVSDRYIMALYYAYGVVDSTTDDWKATLSPTAFAEFHSGAYADFLNGRTSAMHSVQDAWRVWVGSKRVAR